MTDHVTNQPKNTHLNTLAVTTLPTDLVQQLVANALAEDVGEADVTASLIPEGTIAKAKVITRENMVLCGQTFVDEVMRQMDSNIKVTWFYQDGDKVAANETLYTLEGRARQLLTAERSALNFLQMLSGTATTTAHYADKLTGYKTEILDTRKTIPGFRMAQKYAVHCGGGVNHRLGLFDAFLIKENHIMACNGIANAVQTARNNYPNRLVEVEVENLDELQQALAAGADVIMLDDFSLADMEKAVAITGEQAELEASGNITLDTIQTVAATGVDFISSGSLTKHVRAIDLSMRIVEENIENV